MVISFSIKIDSIFPIIFSLTPVHYFSKLLLKNRKDPCPEYKYVDFLYVFCDLSYSGSFAILISVTNLFPFRNVHKVKGHPSLQKGGCHEVHDIEDLVKIGQVVKGSIFFSYYVFAELLE